MFVLKAEETDEVCDLPLANSRGLAHANWLNRQYIHTCMCIHIYIYDIHICAHACICVHVLGREKEKMSVINIHCFWLCHMASFLTRN